MNAPNRLDRARRAVSVLLVGLAITLAAGPVARGQAAGFVDCASALNETIRSGRPTVVVVTSRAAPGSLMLRDAIARDLLPSSIGRSVQFAEMPVELFAERLQQLGVTRTPSLLAYGHRDGSLIRLGQLADPSDPAQVAAWMGSIGLLGGGSTPSDPAVSRAGFSLHHQATAIPSPQQALPPLPQKPQPPAQGMIAVPHAVPVPQAMSPVIAQPSGPPVIVQQQSPAIYIQPQAPRILLGQMPPPEITVLQGPPGTPTVNYAVVGPPPSTPNLFLTPSTPTPPPSYGVPSPQSPMVAAPPAMSPTPAPSYAMVAPAPGVPAPQDSIVAATAIAFLLENPDAIGTILGAIGKGFTFLGQTLEKYGHPHLRVNQPAPPAVAKAFSLVPAGAFATPTAAQAQLIAVPSQGMIPASAPPVMVPPAVVPSPQSDGHHGLFSRWHHP